MSQNIQNHLLQRTPIVRKINYADTSDKQQVIVKDGFHVTISAPLAVEQGKPSSAYLYYPPAWISNLSSIPPGKLHNR